MLKRIMSVLLACMLIFASAPLGALVGLDLFSMKASAATYSGTCGINLTWTLDTETGELVISGTGDMTNWLIPSSVPWDGYRPYIKTVMIKNGVESIEYCAFAGCYNMTSVTIPDTVTRIDAWAFNECHGLTNVIIGNSVTSIGEYAFYNCKKLASVTIPDCLIVIGRSAFAACQSLESITISDSVENIGDYVFYDCSGLTYVTIPNSVKHIGFAAFYNCSMLTDVYYCGSMEEWQKISIDDYNEPLANTTIHFIEAVDVVVKKAPSKTEYNYKQDNIDISGIELEVTYSDGNKKIIKDTSAMTVSGFSNEKTGEQTVTVEYEGLKAEYKVTVKYTWWQWILVILLFGWIWY